MYPILVRKLQSVEDNATIKIKSGDEVVKDFAVL